MSPWMSLCWRYSTCWSMHSRRGIILKRMCSYRPVMRHLAGLEPLKCSTSWKGRCTTGHTAKGRNAWDLHQYRSFLGSITPTMAASTGHNGTGCLGDWQAACAALQTRCRTFCVQGTQKKKTRSYSNSFFTYFFIF